MMSALEPPPALINVPFCERGHRRRRHGEPDLSRHKLVVQSAQ
jgi:hypothetical protein